MTAVELILLSAQLRSSLEGVLGINIWEDIIIEDDKVVITVHDDYELACRIKDELVDAIVPYVEVRNAITPSQHSLPHDHAMQVAARLCRGSMPMPSQIVTTIYELENGIYTLEGYDVQDGYDVAILSDTTNREHVITVPVVEVFALVDVTETALALMGRVS